RIADGAVEVWTSAERAPAPSAEVPFLDVAIGWPDPRLRLVVNPGTPLELAFPGEQVAGFVGWAQDFVAAAAGAGAGAAVPPAPGEMLHVEVPAELVGAYLRGHRSDVSGVVLRDADPVAAGTEGYLIRWPATCPPLYRPGAGGVLRAHAVTLPHGAEVLRRDRRGGRVRVASFDADVRQWVAAPDTDLLRRAMAS